MSEMLFIINFMGKRSDSEMGICDLMQRETSTDAILALRMLLEKDIENLKELHCVLFEGLICCGDGQTDI